MIDDFDPELLSCQLVNVKMLVAFYVTSINGSYADLSLSKKLKILLRGLLFFCSTLTWLGFITNNDFLKRSLSHWPRLLERSQRPYLRNGFGPSKRIALSIQHIQLFERFVATGIAQTIARGESYRLATVEGKDEKAYSFVLTSASDHEKEGDLMLRMINAKTGDRLAVITFSLSSEAGAVQVNVGGLQGASMADGTVGEICVDAIRDGTRALYGLRPKQAVLIALQQFAAVSGIKSLVATSNRNHIYNGWLSKQLDLASDYDAFWEEQGGTLRPDGDYCLPLRRHVKDIESIASKKRAEYLRRQAVIDSLENQIHTALIFTPLQA